MCTLPWCLRDKHTDFVFEQLHCWEDLLDSGLAVTKQQLPFSESSFCSRCCIKTLICIISFQNYVLGTIKMTALQRDIRELEHCSQVTQLHELSLEGLTQPDHVGYTPCCLPLDWSWRRLQSEKPRQQKRMRTGLSEVETLKRTQESTK